MLEYVFFESQFRKQFVLWLARNGIPYQASDTEMELLVLIDEDIDDDTEERVEDQYDLIMLEQAASADQQDNPEDHIHLVGIQYTATDGNVHQVRLTPAIVNRITQCIDAIELQELVQTIANGVLNPDDRPLCRK